ncbi:biotin/lipoyl-binding protein [bacterium]|nr:biotin/lipoyl-binding protein [bacterium]
MANEVKEDMKFRVVIGSSHYQVEVNDPGIVIVNGRPYHVDLDQDSLLVNKRSYEISSLQEENGLPTLISVNQETYRLEIEEAEKVAPRRKIERLKEKEEGAITSPMSGQIISVEANEGDQVGKDEVILILEAMKMESEVFSPKEGRIKEIRVAKGDMVNTGDVLAIIE